MLIRLAPKYRKLIHKASRDLGIPSVQIAQNIIAMYCEEILAAAAGVAHVPDEKAADSDRTEQLPDPLPGTEGDTP